MLGNLQCPFKVLGMTLELQPKNINNNGHQSSQHHDPYNRCSDNAACDSIEQPQSAEKLVPLLPVTLSTNSGTIGHESLPKPLKNVPASNELYHNSRQSIIVLQEFQSPKIIGSHYQRPSQSEYSASGLLNTPAQVNTPALSQVSGPENNNSAAHDMRLNAVELNVLTSNISKVSEVQDQTPQFKFSNILPINAAKRTDSTSTRGSLFTQINTRVSQSLDCSTPRLPINSQQTSSFIGVQGSSPGQSLHCQPDSGRSGTMSQGVPSIAETPRIISVETSETPKDANSNESPGAMSGNVPSSDNDTSITIVEEDSPTALQSSRELPKTTRILETSINQHVSKRRATPKLVGNLKKRIISILGDSGFWELVSL